MNGVRRPLRKSAAIVVVAVLGIALLGACSSSKSAAPTPTTRAESIAVAVERARPYAFAVEHLTFVDTSRPTATPTSPAYSKVRTLPTDLYLPTASGKRPLVVFSHGYHGAPAKFTQLFSAWARAGYIVAAPRFPLTSNRGAPYDEVTDYVEQPADVSFVLDQLLEGRFGSRIDAHHIGAAGLSLGGGTTYGLVDNPCCREHRLAAAAVFDGERFPFAQPFGRNSVPILIMHIDTDIVLPYAHARQSFVDSASPKYFVTLHGGIHAEPYEDTPSPHDATVQTVSTEYWDLTLLGDASARARMVAAATRAGEASIVAG